MNTEYYLKLDNLTQIFEEGQFGRSYHADAVLQQAAPDAIDRGEAVISFYKLEWPTSSRKKNRVFIKCLRPDDERITAEQELEYERFVESEYKNGQSLNAMATRLSKEKNCVQLVRMYGRGKLARSRGPHLDCLVYEFVESPKESSTTLSLDTTIKRKWSTEGFLTFARSLSRAVQVVHNQGIVHSFIVPRNIIFRVEKGVAGENTDLSLTLAGFGYARYSDTASPRSTSTERSPHRFAERDQWFRAPECRTLSSHGTFGYTADIYSIGAILYLLLVNSRDPGNESEEREVEDVVEKFEVLRKAPKDVRLLKQCVFRSLDTFGGIFWKRNENIVKIIDSTLRYRPEDRFTCVEELIEAIDIAIASESEKNPSKRTSLEVEDLPGDYIDKMVEDISESDSKHANKILPNYFQEIQNILARDTASRYSGLHKGHFEIYGHRDRIVTSLCRLLASTRRPGIYNTMTLPDYWTDSNLGTLGRFLIMNKHMARREVQINRLFLVSERNFHALPEIEQIVLEDQMDSQRDVAGHAAGKLDIRVLYKPAADIVNFEKNGELVAFLNPRPLKKLKVGKCFEEGDLVNTICLNFFSTTTESWSNGTVSVNRVIHKVRFWNPMIIGRAEQFTEGYRKFSRDWDSAVPLYDYIYGYPEISTVPDSLEPPTYPELKKLIGA